METIIDATRFNSLTSLPAELFGGIILDLLEIVGLRKAVRLRAVNSKFTDIYDETELTE